MNLSRRNQLSSRRARRRGVIALEELFSMAALMACFVGPIAVAARSIGPQLAKDMDRRVHTLRSQETSVAPASTLPKGGLDFGSGVPTGIQP